MTVNMTNPEDMNATVYPAAKKGSGSKKKSGASARKKSGAAGKKKASSDSKSTKAKGGSAGKKSGSKLVAGLVEEEEGLNRMLTDTEKVNTNKLNDVQAEEKDLLEETLDNFNERELFSDDATNKLFLD